MTELTTALRKVSDKLLDEKWITDPPIRTHIVIARIIREVADELNDEELEHIKREWDRE